MRPIWKCLFFPASVLKAGDVPWLIVEANSSEVKVHITQDCRETDMFFWLLLAAFILLSIEDFYQILGKWVYWLHCCHAGKRLMWGYTSITFLWQKPTLKSGQTKGKEFFVILLTFNMIVQPCSQRAKTTSCRLHVTHYFRFGHRT